MAQIPFASGGFANPDGDRFQLSNLTSNTLGASAEQYEDLGHLLLAFAQVPGGPITIELDGGHVLLWRVGDACTLLMHAPGETLVVTTPTPQELGLVATEMGVVP